MPNRKKELNKGVVASTNAIDKSDNFSKEVKETNKEIKNNAEKELAKDDGKKLGETVSKNEKNATQDSIVTDIEKTAREGYSFNRPDIKDDKKEEDKYNPLDKTESSDKGLDKKIDATNKEVKDSVSNNLDLYNNEVVSELSDYLDDNLSKRKTTSDLKNYLPNFAISRYLNGDFGDKDSKQAKQTLGFFLLDKIGKGMINASQVARGMTPSEKTALQTYNEKQMENALKRDDEKLSKIQNIDLDNISKNSDEFRNIGISGIKLGNDSISNALRQYQDQIDDKTLLATIKENADWLEKMSEKDKESMLRLLALRSGTTNERVLSLIDIQESQLKAQYASTEAEKEKLKADTLINTIRAKMTPLEAKKFDTEIQILKKENKYYDANAIAGVASKIGGTAGSIVGAIFGK